MINPTKSKKALLIVVTGFLSALGIFFFPQSGSSSSGILPFEGTITDIEYNCLCSGSILLTIQPTQASQQQGAQQKKLLLIWAAQLMEELAEEFGIEPPVPLIIPRTYLWCQVYYSGDQQLLGNYIPGGFPCYEFVGPPDYCRFKENAEGAILNVGTSLY